MKRIIKNKYQKGIKDFCKTQWVESNFRINHYYRILETNLQENRHPQQIVWRVVFPGEEYKISNTEIHPKILNYNYKFFNIQYYGKYFGNIKIHFTHTTHLLHSFEESHFGFSFCSFVTVHHQFMSRLWF